MGSRGMGFILRMMGSRVFNAENDLKRTTHRKRGGRGAGDREEAMSLEVACHSQSPRHVAGNMPTPVKAKHIIESHMNHSPYMNLRFSPASLCNLPLSLPPPPSPRSLLMLLPNLGCPQIFAERLLRVWYGMGTRNVRMNSLVLALSPYVCQSNLMQASKPVLDPTFSSQGVRQTWVGTTLGMS